MKIWLSRIALSFNPAGGMERAAANMANELTKRGDNVSLCYYNPKRTKWFYNLTEGVNTIHLEKYASSRKIFGIRQKVAKEILRIVNKQAFRDWKYHCIASYFKEPLEAIMSSQMPDVLISFDWQTTYFWKTVLGKENPFPIITMFHFPVSEAVDWNSELEVRTLCASDVIQVLLPEDKMIIQKHCPSAHVEVIPNAVPFSKNYSLLNEHKAPFHIIHVGRFSEHGKRQHLLLQAFMKLNKDFPEWDLTFWGNGEKKYQEKLKKLVMANHLENRVFFKGTTHNLNREYVKSDLFVFPSKFEGFGMAMVEAMAAGLPAIAFKSCNAASAIIKDGVNGMLADDGIEGLSEAMKVCMNDKNLRTTLGSNARKTAWNYNPELVWNKWENLLNNLE